MLKSKSDNVSLFLRFGHKDTQVTDDFRLTIKLKNTYRHIQTQTQTLTDIKTTKAS